jgi:purine-binding chemotaxis protein CheW
MIIKNSEITIYNSYIKMDATLKSKLNSYLSFRLEGETFGTNVGSVLSILEMVRITKVPCSPAYLKGVINLRGEVLPIIDLRLRFGMPASDISASTCILVMEIRLDSQDIKVGVMVDSVSEVHEIEPKELLPPPGIASKFRSEFIEGMYKNGDGFIMLLHMDKIFSYDELQVINSSVQMEQPA